MTDEPTVPMFALALGNATTDHRNAVQALVREHSGPWWHHLPDVWIVSGKTHKEWANLIAPVLDGRAKLLVLELPSDKRRRMFALRGPFKKTAHDWIWKVYYGRTRPSKRVVRRNS